jgi:hypothetical protein
MTPTGAEAVATETEGIGRVRHGPNPRAWARWHAHLETCEEPAVPPVRDPLVGGVRILPYTGPRPRGVG